MEMDVLKWLRLVSRVEMILRFDNDLRERGETFFHHRSWTEKGLEELKQARMGRSKLRRVMRFNLSSKGRIGIANAMCKLMGIAEIYAEKYPECYPDYEFAKEIWSRCHLYERRVEAGRKAYCTKRSIAFPFDIKDTIPDYRDPKFHEGSKGIYKLSEVGGEE